MNPKAVVTCLPTRDLERSLEFYRGCFRVPDLAIEEGMLVVELGNLSLFIMSQESFEDYTDTIGSSAGYPGQELQVIHSCAVENQAELDHVFATAAEYGGSVAKPLHTNQWDQEVGYIRDPDGHVWELVKVAE